MNNSFNRLNTCGALVAAVAATACAHGAAKPAAGASINAVAPVTAAAPLDTPITTIATLVSRLELEKYKATVKGLTQFGDRRQGTDRNRAAVDWIEAQLKSDGCPT
ncbi:MAG TPA: hypothetical protein VK617_04215, partial [Gemmatimonadaceae bacterium]|nr:hypothetical protein [Gemmatimonadaceae bacterium]